MRSLGQLFLLSFAIFNLNAQMVVLQPTSAGPDEAATIIFDANSGNKELKGASKVYVHHGVVTDKVNGTAWKYVKGNWGIDDGIGEMTRVSGETDKWQMTFISEPSFIFGMPPTTAKVSEPRWLEDARFCSATCIPSGSPIPEESYVSNSKTKAGPEIPS